MDKYDLVNHPKHYNDGPIECIDLISLFISDRGLDPFEAYLISNILKYTFRYNTKGTPVQDLEKARWYLDKLIKKVGETPDPNSE